MSATARHARAESIRGRGRFALVGLVVAVAGLGGGGFIFTRGIAAEQACPRSVSVVASPDIAPVVRAVTNSMASTGQSCPSFVVRARDAASVATAIQGGSAVPADVWIPDSSLWLQRTGRTDDSTGSVARSPIVLAAAPVLGGRITADGDSSGISAVAPMDGRRPVTIVLSRPRDSARSSGTLIALQSALASRSDARRVFAGLLQSATVDPDPEKLAGPLAVAAGTAVPASEQQVFVLNQNQVTPRALALYATGPGSVLDYPLAVLSRSVRDHTQGTRLLAALRGSAGQDLVRAAGFRDSTGRPDGALEDTIGLDAGRPSGAPPVRAGDAAAVLTELSSVRQPANLLAVLDVSGSMATPVPGTDSSRMDMVLRAAARGLELYPDRNTVGLWTFSTRLQGDLDYRPRVRPTLLGRADDPSGGRARLGAALARVRPTDGSTGLYDTILAAVRSQRQSWLPGHTNAVLLLTDGRNEDPQGIVLPRLLDILRQEQDPARPVPVIAIAYGSDTGAEAALRRVSAVTGGATYTSRPQQIEQVMLDALGQRSCRPLCRPGR